jgi:hypothetical protein
MAGTLVWMADGSTEPVEDVKAGDWVLSRDPSTGKVSASRVGQCTERVAGSVVAVTLTDGQSGQSQTVVASPEHPFFVSGKGFVAAASLGVGTQIVTRAGPTLTVTAVDEERRDGGFAVYNFVVPGDHTYFVGTLDGGAWVHNPIDCNSVANTTHPVTGVRYDAAGNPMFSSKFTVSLPPHLIGPAISDDRQMGFATRQLRSQLHANPAEKAGYTAAQQKAITTGSSRIPGHTWHHYENGIDLQLVDRKIHKLTGHNGGRRSTGGRP